jgi:hypothetical protein
LLKRKRRRNWAANHLTTPTETLLLKQPQRIMMMPMKEVTVQLMRKMVLPEVVCPRARRKRIRRTKSDIYLSLRVTIKT